MTSFEDSKEQVWILAPNLLDLIDFGVESNELARLISRRVHRFEA